MTPDEIRDRMRADPDAQDAVARAVRPRITRLGGAWGGHLWGEHDLDEGGWLCGANDEAGARFETICDAVQVACERYEEARRVLIAARLLADDAGDAP